MVFHVLTYLLVMCLNLSVEAGVASGAVSDVGGSSGVFMLVMSARDHFDRRNVIRNTWKSEASGLGVNVFFVVGKQG